jgi:hypothetical protein
VISRRDFIQWDNIRIGLLVHACKENAPLPKKAGRIPGLTKVAARLERRICPEGVVLPSCCRRRRIGCEIRLANHQGCVHVVTERRREQQ